MALNSNKNLEELFDLPASDHESQDSDEAAAGNDIATNLPWLP